jgi:hypothetical protein
MEFNFVSEHLRALCKFNVPLTDQPQFFQINDEQTVAIVASNKDVIYYDF